MNNPKRGASNRPHLLRLAWASLVTTFLSAVLVALVIFNASRAAKPTSGTPAPVRGLAAAQHVHKGGNLLAEGRTLLSALQYLLEKEPEIAASNGFDHRVQVSPALAGTNTPTV